MRAKTVVVNFEKHNLSTNEGLRLVLNLLVLLVSVRDIVVGGVNNTFKSEHHRSITSYVRCINTS